MSRAEIRDRMGAHENQAEQAWTTHRVMLLNEKSVAGDALENQKTFAQSHNSRTSKASKAKSRASARISSATCSTPLVRSSTEVQIQHVASRQDAEHLRHELSHLTVHSRNLETQSIECQSTVSSLEAQIAQILRLRGMIEVEPRIHSSLNFWVGPAKRHPSCNKLAAIIWALS